MMPQSLVAQLFHVHRKTLQRWQAERGFPKPFYVGKLAFYRAIELRLWQEKQFQVGQESGLRKTADRTGQREKPA